METIILGRKGNQPFPITANGVSAEHAKITIDGDKWTLEDLNSTNGTFIREENGTVRRIIKVSITPMTFIYLGPINTDGCFFCAHHVKTPGDFHEDYNFMNEKVAEMRKKEKFEERLNWFIKLGTLILTVVLIMCITKIVYMRLVAIISPVIALLFDSRRRIIKLHQRYQRFFDCPNPRCTNHLQPTSVERRRCPECRNKV